jgi:hypothetical protein
MGRPHRQIDFKREFTSKPIVVDAGERAVGKNAKQTSPKVASLAGKILQSKSSSKTAKTIAASDLAQAAGKAKKKK